MLLSKIQYYPCTNRLSDHKHYRTGQSKRFKLKTCENVSGNIFFSLFLEMQRAHNELHLKENFCSLSLCSNILKTRYAEKFLTPRM